MDPLWSTGNGGFPVNQSQETAYSFPAPSSVHQSTRDDRGNYGSGMTESCLYLTFVDLEMGDFPLLMWPEVFRSGGNAGVCFDFLVIHLI